MQFLAKAFPEQKDELLREIQQRGGHVVQEFSELVVYSGFKERPLWAQFVGVDPYIHKFESISDGAEHLLSIQKRWCSLSSREHRRAELIQEKVFRYKIPQFKFLQDIPEQSWGFWSLIEKNEMVVCRQIDTPVPLGEFQFVETKEPPSRAYLKLWEAITRWKVGPNAEEYVVDLGACPGGWTWVLAQMNCKVTAVDKAALDPKVMSMGNVTYLKKDAFKMTEVELGNPHWIFSDIICFPKDLYELVMAWRERGVKNFICTLKFKGETDWESIRQFEKIPGGKLVHLCANKHELTFINFQKEN